LEGSGDWDYCFRCCTEYDPDEPCPCDCEPEHVEFLDDEWWEEEEEL
jgi:hypothetical protein